MHEASIAQAILDQVLKALPAPDSRVTKISLIAGPFAGIEFESLNFYFEELKKDTPAAPATLEMKTLSATIICTSCSHQEDFTPGSELKTKCPICSAPNRVTGSSDFYIDSIEVEEE
ncbi:MAG: hypothetical protein A2Y07_10150 [Planctomycetes bacterium GWF2_50_10]|nr:MAG: hypothetical protein A2Y07_10150 [Planctomycetes bacterium GWF2_50_10]